MEQKKKYAYRIFLLLMVAASLFSSAGAQAVKKKKKSAKSLPLPLSLEAPVSGKLKTGKSREYSFTLEQKRELELNFTVKKGNNKSNGKLNYQLYKKKKKLFNYTKTVKSDKSNASSYLLPKGNYRIVLTGDAGYRYKLLLRDVTKQPTKLKVLKKDYKLMYKESVKLEYEIKKPVAEFVGEDKVNWQTTNPDVATVEQGRVTANGPGKCKVIAILPNGKTYKFTIKVPKLNFDQRIYYDKFAVGCGEVKAEDATVSLSFINRFSNKQVKKVYFTIYQYDGKGRRIKKGMNKKPNRKLKAVIEPGNYATYSYGISPDARWLRVCVKKVEIAKTASKKSEKAKKKNKVQTWESSYYKKWTKKYSSYYSKKFEKQDKKAAKKKK